jgi:hypothetical protein
MSGKIGQAGRRARIVKIVPATGAVDKELNFQ